MRIAQVAPRFESGTACRVGARERVVSWLAEELERLGHEITLFTSGDLRTVFTRAADFDVLHFHLHPREFPLLRRTGLPALTTLYGAPNAADHQVLFEEYDDFSLVSLSNAQRVEVPNGSFIATVHPGMPLDLYRFEPRGGDYLAFLGSAAPESGLERAIEIAVRSGTKLKIAARSLPAERGHYEGVIAPLLREAGQLVELVRDASAEAGLLAGARALLFPVDWEDPFGLVMLEALACGTPVVGFRRGSVPEIIDDGRTGFIVEDVEETLSVLPALGRIDRKECRAAFERRFGVERMATEYIAAYGKLGERRSGLRMIAPPEPRLLSGTR